METKETRKSLMEYATKRKLDDIDFEKIEALTEAIKNGIEKVVQDFIDEEVKEFRQNNPEATIKRTYDVKKNSMFGIISLKIPEFHNGNFQSLVFRNKTRNFFSDIFVLCSLIYTGEISYSHLFKYCNLMNLSISNQEIANMVKAIAEIKRKELNK